MYRKLWFKATSIALLALIPIALRLAPTTFAGAPQPGPGFTKIKGPDIKGELTAMFVVADSGVVGADVIPGTAATILARCKGKTFVLGPFFFPGTQADFIDGTTEANLETGWIVNDAGPAGCLSTTGGEALFLDKVKSFDTKTDTLVIADIKIIGIH
jgi:hypothetical protein